MTRAEKAMAALVAFCAPLATSCGTSGASQASGDCARYDAVYAASDYTSSGFGALALGGDATYVSSVELGSDPVLSLARGRLFLVARDNDAVFELDPRCGTALGKIGVHDPSHDGTSNPQDVALAADGALWIPRYNVPSILISEANGKARAVIDLSAYDEDHNPNASAIRILDVSGVAKAFVTLERLDDTQSPPRPRLASQLLRLDVASAAIEAAIPLEGRNPFGLVEHGGALLIAEPGDFSATDDAAAGIERFEPQTSSTRLFVHEADLAGSVAEIAVTDRCGAAIVADASAKNRTALVTFDPDSGAVLTTASAPALGPTEGFDLQGMAWKGDVLLVGDRRQTSRGYAVHAFDRSDACSLHARTDTLYLPQKPVAIRVAPQD